MAREDVIRKMKKNHCDETDAKRKVIKLRMDVELPFICEDIFDIENYHGTYTHAGTTFKPWLTTDETGEEVMTQTLEVTLTSVIREKEPIKINTPQRKKCREVVHIRRQTSFFNYNINNQTKEIDIEKEMAFVLFLLMALGVN